MRYAGIDYGKKRVGVALSDEGLSFALPKVVLLNYKNEENAIMEEAKDFAKKISGVTGVNVVFEPEFLTSAEAERVQGKNKMHDASAAAIILKSYMAKNK